MQTAAIVLLQSTFLTVGMQENFNSIHTKYVTEKLKLEQTTMHTFDENKQNDLLLHLQ